MIKTDNGYIFTNEDTDITSEHITIPSDIGGVPVTAIGEGTFRDCYKLKSIHLPDSITDIAAGAFSADSLGVLSEITVSENNSHFTSENGVLFSKDMKTLICCPVKSSGEYTVPEGVTKIGDYAFACCDALEHIHLPDSVRTIGAGAFSSCFFLHCIHLPDGVSEIGAGAFAWCAMLGHVQLPDSVHIIGASAFEWCSSVSSVHIPENVTSIGAGAFSCCEALSEITVSENNKHFVSRDGVLFTKDMKTLICCPAAKSGEYTVPEGVSVIGERAFDECTQLACVHIPEGVTVIGKEAFLRCGALACVHIPESVTAIGERAFEWCASLEHMHITENVASIGTGAFSCCGALAEITVSEENEHFMSENGVLFTKDMKTLVCCPAKTSGEYTVPEGVCAIGEKAFYGCEAVEAVHIPESVTEIGDWAFLSCELLRSVNIPEGVTEIGSMVFFSCNSLANVRIPKNVARIGECAFSSCAAPGEVYYASTEDDWKRIKIERNNDCLLNAKIHFNA